MFLNINHVLVVAFLLQASDAYQYPRSSRKGAKGSFKEICTSMEVCFSAFGENNRFCMGGEVRASPEECENNGNKRCMYSFFIFKERLCEQMIQNHEN